MKKLILSCLLGAAALSAAAESKVTYTYANDTFRTWGRFKSQTYDLAMRITDPRFIGKKITSIRAVLNADEGLESTSIWLSKELNLEKVDGVKVTVPDTYSKDVQLDKTTVPGHEGTFGQLSATLDTPYELTADGIYVGYTFTVPPAAEGEELTFEQKQPVIVSPCRDSNSLYVRASKDFMSWTCLNDKIDAGAAIYVTFEGDFKEYNISIMPRPKVYAAVSEDFAVKATLSNVGAATVSQIGYTYTIEGNEYSNTIDLDSPIEPNFVSSSAVTFPVDGIADLGEYTLGLKITDINGSSVDVPEVSTKVTVLKFVPVHRPMLEEFTGTWCGWCTRGTYSLQLLNEMYGDDVVLAAYHVGDPMAAANTPVSVSGCPTSTLNRTGLIDPFYGNSKHNTFGMKDMVAASMEELAPASIEMSATWANEEKTSISVNTETKFVNDENDACCKIGFLLINDGLTGTESGWIQNNDYANSPSAYVGSDLDELTKWPAKIVGMVYDDVVVDVTAMDGMNGSLPSSVESCVTYEYEYSFDIADNTKIQDKDKLYVAAFIISPDGTILNANKVKVGAENGVGSLEAGLTEASAEYYSLSGIRVASPRQGIFVKVSKMSDGSVRTRKVAIH